MAEPPKYSPLTLIGIVVIVMLGFAAFFISFLVAPLAILALFYFVLAASERSKGESKPKGDEEGDVPPPSARAQLLQRETEARERQLEREREQLERERAELEAQRAAGGAAPPPAPGA
jgi:hypothetical protein